MELTQYRTINDGYWDYLQYKVIKKNFWGKEKEEWVHVPDARFDRFHDLEHFFACDRLISSLHHNIDKWVKQYPNVSVWLEEREKLLKENQALRDARNAEIENKKGKIRYF